MKRWISSLLIMLLLSLVMVGCVSQRDYDAVVKERDEIKTQMASLQVDFNKTKSDYDTINSKYTDYKSNIGTIAARLAKEVKALTSFNSFIVAIGQLGSFDSSQSNTSIITSSNIPLTSTTASAVFKFLIEFESAIQDIGNAQMIQKWTEYKTSAMTRDKEEAKKLVSVLDLLNKLTSDDIKALETEINKK